MANQGIHSINTTIASELEPDSKTTLKITLENLAPEAGTGIAQYWFAFQDGSFDLFNVGATASSQLELLAEDGMGADFIVSGSEVLDAGTEVNDEDPANIPYTLDVFGNSVEENGTIQSYPDFLPPGEGGVVDFEVNGEKVFANADFTVPDYQIARITITEVDDPLIPELNVDPDTQLVTVDDLSPSISVLWDRAAQQAVINTEPGPTIASRAYAMVHTAMFDAWAAYDPTAIATQLGDDLQRPEEEITAANKEEAMSFAAYRVLTDLFSEQGDIFNDLMAQRGFPVSLICPYG